MAKGTTKYTKAIAKKICDGVARGESVAEICKPKGMPGERTVYTWLREDTHKGFREQYTRAREEQGDYFADRIGKIAGELEDAITHVEVEGKRAAVDAYKWLAGKRAPKVYGDLSKIELEHSGSGGGPIQINLIRGVDPRKKGGG